jgi:ABC-type branched-subunit amino acid transport system substrate-binding protein
VLYAPDATDRALAQAFADAFAGAGGTIADFGSPARDDWARRIGPREGHAPDVAFLAADAPTAADWIVALRSAGFEGTLVGGPALGSSLVVDIAGKASEGVLFVSPFPPAMQDPGVVDAFRELSGGTSPGPAASWAYAAANRLLDAVDRAARTKDPELRAAVQNTWVTTGGDPHKIYSYTIQSGNVYTDYPSR